MPVQTRRQLATDPKMCMFALTVSIVKPNNIKEAMANSAWIEAMHDELYQFDRLKVWELVDKPFGKMIIKLKWLWKNKKDEDSNLLIRNKAQNYGRENNIFNGPLKEEVYVAQPEGFVDHISIQKVYLSEEGWKADLYGLNKAPKSLNDLVQARCYCAGYQAYDQLKKHLKEVKRIFKYLKAEAEYVALSTSCAQVMWMRIQLQDYGFNYNKIPLYCDS
ncbi:hypothetical protein Tco_1107202 [Tanacetum coccineum]